jgi:hypothetical protein
MIPPVSGPSAQTRALAGALHALAAEALPRERHGGSLETTFSGSPLQFTDDPTPGLAGARATDGRSLYPAIPLDGAAAPWPEHAVELPAAEARRAVPATHPPTTTAAPTRRDLAELERKAEFSRPVKVAAAASAEENRAHIEQDYLAVIAQADELAELAAAAPPRSPPIVGPPIFSFDSVVIAPDFTSPGGEAADARELEMVRADVAAVREEMLLDGASAMLACANVSEQSAWRLLG